MRVVWAFVVRDFRVAWSYRLNFFAGTVGVLLSVLSLRLVSELFSGQRPAALLSYGGDYFSFALVGIAVTALSYPAVKTIAGGVRNAQVSGTFEMMLSTRARTALIVLSAGVYPILMACVELALLVGFGTLILGAHLQLAHLALTLLVLSMTLTALAGIGCLSAAFVILFQQTEPFTQVFLAASLLLSGTVYPITVLPAWVRPISALLPETHAIELARGFLLHGAQPHDALLHFAALALFCLLLPAGVASLSFAIERAKRAGSLSHY